MLLSAENEPPKLNDWRDDGQAATRGAGSKHGRVGPGGFLHKDFLAALVVVPCDDRLPDLGWA